MQVVINYLKDIQSLYKQDEKKEHSYRTIFENFLNAILVELKLTNKIAIIQEAKSQDGIRYAPDFVVKSTENDTIIGYIETKPIDSSYFKDIEKSGQIKKYLEITNNLLVCNYVDFKLLNTINTEENAGSNFVKYKEESKDFSFNSKEFTPKIKELTLKNKDKLELQEVKLGHPKYFLEIDVTDEMYQKIKSLLAKFFNNKAQAIRKPKILAKKLASRSRILKEYLEEELTVQESAQRGQLYGLYIAFRNNLSADISRDEFVDAYAQMLSYSLFLAKLNVKGEEKLTLENIKTYIDTNFALIAEMVKYMDVLVDLRYEIAKKSKWLVMEMLEVVNAIDSYAIAEQLAYNKEKQQLADPYLYFYEDFLQQYDKDTKKNRGVYYTPPEAVRYIVQSIDSILQNELDINNGLGNHKVKVLDFATGTGTFLFEVYKQILDATLGSSNKYSFTKEQEIKANKENSSISAGMGNIGAGSDNIREDNSSTHNGNISAGRGSINYSNSGINVSSGSISAGMGNIGAGGNIGSSSNSIGAGGVSISEDHSGTYKVNIREESSSSENGFSKETALVQDIGEGSGNIGSGNNHREDNSSIKEGSGNIGAGSNIGSSNNSISAGGVSIREDNSSTHNGNISASRGSISAGSSNINVSNHNEGNQNDGNQNEGNRNTTNNQAKIHSLIQEHILKNIYGFEFLVAPYAVAHLKLSQYLKSYNYEMKPSERIQVYLTNTLSELSPQYNSLMPELSSEGEKSNEIKTTEDLMVILGNPPYNANSKNTSKELTGTNKGKNNFIGTLLEDYKPQDEKNIKYLEDDYLKFIRFAHYKMQDIDKGVIGIIVNNSFINGLNHRKMRNSLLKDFSKIYIFNLHGHSRGQGNKQNDTADENIFAIQQGVCIALLVKNKESKEFMLPAKENLRNTVESIQKITSESQTLQTESLGKNNATSGVKNHSAMAQVFYYEIFGDRKSKKHFLNINDYTTHSWQELDIKNFNQDFNSTPWAVQKVETTNISKAKQKDLELFAEDSAEIEANNQAIPKYIETPRFLDDLSFFVPMQNNEILSYGRGLSIVEIFKQYTSAVISKKDEVSMHLNEESLNSVLKDLKVLDNNTFASKYNALDSRDWTVQSARDDISSNQGNITKILYRPFDYRYTYYSNKNKGFLARPSYKIMQHFLTNNLGINFIRMDNNIEDYSYCFISNAISDIHLLGGGNYTAPLYLTKTTKRKISKFKGTKGKPTEIFSEIEERTIVEDNFSTYFKEFIQKKYQNSYSPQEILGYIYAIMYSKNYKSKYLEFLKIDFPRIIFVDDEHLFKQFVKLGLMLIDVHLLKNLNKYWQQFNVEIQNLLQDDSIKQEDVTVSKGEQNLATRETSLANGGILLRQGKSLSSEVNHLFGNNKSLANNETTSEGDNNYANAETAPDGDNNYASDGNVLGTNFSNAKNSLSNNKTILSSEEAVAKDDSSLLNEGTPLRQGKSLSSEVSHLFGNNKSFSKKQVESGKRNPRVQSLHDNNLQYQGVQSQAVEANKSQSQDIQAQKAQIQEMKSQGIQSHKIQSQEISSQEMQIQEMRIQEIQEQGLESQQPQAKETQSQEIQGQKAQTQEKHFQQQESQKGSVGGENTTLRKLEKSSFCGENSMVEKISYNESDHRLYINKTSYFSNVLKGVYNYKIHYSVLEKYLSYRKNQSLSLEDISQLENTITSLTLSLVLENKIDNLHRF